MNKNLAIIVGEYILPAIMLVALLWIIFGVAIWIAETLSGKQLNKIRSVQRTLVPWLLSFCMIFVLSTMAALLYFSSEITVADSSNRVNFVMGILIGVTAVVLALLMLFGRLRRFQGASPILRTLTAISSLTLGLTVGYQLFQNVIR